ncbi:MAG: PKD domain-containing protein, partial [Bacteroidota bacterium]
FCDDTPDSDQPNYSCSGPAPVNCGSADMYQNYMDYSDDACMNIFTQCQATRMRTVMQYSPRRAALLNSNACTQQVAPVADFQANFTTVCEGSTVSFQDLSGNANSWNWTFENGNPATSTLQNPQVVFSTAGSYKVTLNAGNAFGSTTEERDDY